MSYWREFQRRHPEWPKLLRDAQGRFVRLNRDIQTRGGTLFSEGTVMEITSAYRGGLGLTDPKDRKRYITGVRPYKVDLLAEGTQ